MDMKKTIKLLALSLLTITLCVSCSKNDTLEPESYFKVGNTKYELSAGSINNYGTSKWYNGYKTHLLLTSKGLKDEGGGDVSGKGHLVEFNMFSTAGKALDNADYESSNPKPNAIGIAEPNAIGTFDFGYYLISYNTENDHVDADDAIVDGKITVSRNGNDYTIVINCTSEEGEKVTGFYKGKLQYFEEKN